MQLLVALATGAAALVAPTQRALPKTVRQFNFGDFGTVSYTHLTLPTKA